MSQGAAPDDPAPANAKEGGSSRAAVKEGDPARTSADPGAGDIEVRSKPVGEPGSGRDDATELSSGNTGGRG
jgi:hypothetical protein